LELSDAEAAAIRKDPREYEDSLWLTADDLLSGRFHPALKRAVRDLQKTRMFQELEDMVENRASEKELAAKAVAYVKFAQQISQCDGAIVQTEEER